MASQIEIVNRALYKLGAGRILSLADNVNRARVMADLWPTTRDLCLRSYLWSFALKRAILDPLADAPLWGYAKQFQLPADFLRMVQVNDIFVGPSMSDYRNSDESMYAIEGQNLLCDLASPLKIRYIWRVNAEGLFVSDFCDALACFLALAGCQQITQSETKKESIRNDLKESLRNAMRVNAIEKPSQPIPDDTWMLGRL